MHLIRSISIALRTISSTDECVRQKMQLEQQYPVVGEVDKTCLLLYICCFTVCYSQSM